MTERLGLIDPPSETDLQHYADILNIPIEQARIKVCQHIVILHQLETKYERWLFGLIYDSD
jgi:hypothetical protein